MCIIVSTQRGRYWSFVNPTNLWLLAIHIVVGSTLLFVNKTFPLCLKWMIWLLYERETEPRNDCFWETSSSLCLLQMEVCREEKIKKIRKKEDMTQLIFCVLYRLTLRIDSKGFWTCNCEMLSPLAVSNLSPNQPPRVSMPSIFCLKCTMHKKIYTKYFLWKIYRAHNLDSPHLRIFTCHNSPSNKNRSTSI